MGHTTRALGLLAAATAVTGVVGIAVHHDTPVAAAVAAPARGPVFADAYTRTVTARSEKLTLDGVFTVFGQKIELKGRGAFSNTVGGTFRLTTSGAGHSVSFTEVVTPTALYLQLPESQRQQFGGLPWVEAPIDFAGSANPSPTQALGVLLGAADDVRRVGATRVGGVPVTEYTASLDPTRAVADVPAALAPVAQRGLAALAAGGVTTIPVTVDIDAAGRARRLVEHLTLKLGGQTETVTMTYELSDFDQPVQVDVPPASQVSPQQSLGDLLGGLGGIGG